MNFDLSLNMSLKALKIIRINKGITQLQLANILKKPQSFISKYENGERRIDVYEFIHICRALDENPSSVIERLEKELTHGF